MKLVPSLRAVLVLCSTTLVMSSPTLAEPLVQGIQMTARLEQQGNTHYSPMQPIVLQVVIKNVTAKPIHYYGSEDNFTVKVQYEDGRIMPTLYGNLITSAEVQSLAAGEEKQFKVIANRHSDMTLDGFYFITVNRLVGFPGSDIISVKSNTLKVGVGLLISTPASNISSRRRKPDVPGPNKTLVVKACKCRST